MNEGWKRFHGTDEEVMWRIQVLDADILAESIDCETLRSMRQCVVNAIVDIEEAEEGRDE